MTNLEILQLKPGATPDEIKKAFRRLAHIHHPDKGGNEAKFKEINSAYQYLMKHGSGEWDMSFKTKSYNTTTGGGSYSTSTFYSASFKQNDFQAAMRKMTEEMKRQTEALRRMQVNGDWKLKQTQGERLEALRQMLKNSGIKL